jgi:hypothetical protein
MTPGLLTVRGKEVVKPVSVLDYNQLMMGVNLTDQLLHSYLIERKRMKLFRRRLNTPVLNVMMMIWE